LEVIYLKMKFEISEFSLYDLDDFFPHIVKLFRYLSVSCLLSMLMVAPAYAQFTLLPSTSKTIEECQSTINDFLSNGIVPDADQAKNAVDYNNASKTLDDAKQANEKAQNELNTALGEQEKANDAVTQAAEARKTCLDGAGVGGPFKCNDYEKTYNDARSKVANLKVSTDKLQENLNSAEQDLKQMRDEFDAVGGSVDEKLNSDQIIDARKNLLGCAIKTGRMNLALVPYFITYIIDFALGLVGLISVLFIVIGGYRYVVGGLGEDKEKGKKTISSALMGMGLALLAWSIVNIILKAITG